MQSLQNLNAALIAVLAAGSLLPMQAAADPRVADAAMRADRTQITDLLRQKADVNGAQADGTTALHWAAMHGDAALVDQLIRQGANVNAVTREGVTVLSLAAASGTGVVVDALLRAGVDIKATVANGETALMTAARTGNLNAVKALLDHGAAVNAREDLREQTALMWAAAEDHADVVQLLLERGADANAATKVVKLAGRRGRTVLQGGFTALLLAARQDAQQSVRLLVEHGADVNLADSGGNTALLIAILNGHFKLAGLLLEKGADANLADKAFNRTPLYAAVDLHTVEYSDRPAPEEDRAEGLKVIETLLAHGANPNVQTSAPVRCRAFCFDGIGWIDRTGATPFFRAAEADDITVMRLLAAHGADAKIATKDGTTPLMAAAGVGYTVGKYPAAAPEDNVAAVKLCLDMGINMDAKNVNGFTALHGAAHKGSDEVVRFLASAGAKLDLIDNEGRTPARIADASHLSGLGGYAHPQTAALFRALMNVQER
jgi:ankyrin repeat protein